jgi:hypothetical protein
MDKSCLRKKSRGEYLDKESHRRLEKTAKFVFFTKSYYGNQGELNGSWNI